MSRGSPYSAEMLSPNTTMTGRVASALCAGAAASGDNPKSRADTANVAAAAVPTIQRRLFMPENTNAIIEVRSLCKRVKDATGELTILEDIDLDVDAGTSVAIVGASGSGKSTLLGLLAGLDNATSGSVRLLGHDMGALTEDERARLRNGSIGFVFQSFQLMPHLTALENVRLPLELQGGIDAHEATTRAQTLLEEVGLGKRTRHYPKLLSGGEQQRVALARAFVTRPAILFADEPTGSLDAATGHAVIDLMFELNAAHGATLVLVTHDTDLARRCSRTVTIEAGHLIP